MYIEKVSNYCFFSYMSVYIIFNFGKKDQKLKSINYIKFKKYLR